MLAALLPEQRAAIEDPSRLKALFCTRRSGKSWAIATYLLLEALEYPGCSCLYLGLTQDTVRAIMNKDVFRVLNRKFQIGARWHDKYGYWQLPNESLIYLRGADANMNELRKIVGQKYRLAIPDEVSKFRQNVSELVYEALLPALGDYLGTVVLSGTPSNVTTGLFYDVTTGKHPGWSVHTWSWRNNRFAYKQIKQTYDGLLERNPGLASVPGFKQEWGDENGKVGWVTDLSALVYRFDDSKNTISKLPAVQGEYTYNLGIDLGYNDPTAFVVAAYSEHDPTLYLVQAEKHKGMTFSDVAERVRGLWRFPELGCRGQYPFQRMVCDSADLQGVEELRQKHKLPLLPAKKQGKRGVIEAMNSDLITGRVKLLPGAMTLVDDPTEQDGAGEWRKLIWDERKLKAIPQRYEEDPRFANHLCDAALYVWRASRNYDAAPEPEPKPNPIKDPDAWAQQEFERMLQARSQLGDRRWPGNIRVGQVPTWVRR